MITIYIIIISLFLWALNYFFPSRNAGLGLRFPRAFRTLKDWKRLQSRFYILVIIANALIFLSSLAMNLPDDQVTAYAAASIILSGLLTIFSPFKK